MKEENKYPPNGGEIADFSVSDPSIKDTEKAERSHLSQTHTLMCICVSVEALHHWQMIAIGQRPRVQEMKRAGDRKKIAQAGEF